MGSKDLSNYRQTYQKGYLTRQVVQTNPLEQFLAWLNHALNENVPEPYAMTLATVSEQGRPHARTVLLREANATGFSFYSNYDSQKGQDLAHHPYAELLFFWPSLEQQVRIQGHVSRVSQAQSEAYFHKRPRDSQIAAWVSQPQSGIVQNRALIEQRFKQLEQEFHEQATIEKPAFWGGYSLMPETYEFWQGRPNRMHDRLKYIQENSDTGWRIERLLP